MLICATFGAKSEDLDEVKDWVVSATRLTAEARESSERGGDYYYFESDAGELIRVVTNRDVQDGETITDASEEWLIAVVIEETTQGSPVLQALEGDLVHFEKVPGRRG